MAFSPSKATPTTNRHLNSTVVSGGQALVDVLPPGMLGSAIPNTRSHHRSGDGHMPPPPFARLPVRSPFRLGQMFRIEAADGDSSVRHEQSGSTSEESGSTFVGAAPTGPDQRQTIATAADDSDEDGKHGLVQISPGTRANEQTMQRKRERLLAMQAARQQTLKNNKENQAAVRLPSPSPTRQLGKPPVRPPTVPSQSRPVATHTNNTLTNTNNHTATRSALDNPQRSNSSKRSLLHPSSARSAVSKAASSAPASTPYKSNKTYVVKKATGRALQTSSNASGSVLVPEPEVSSVVQTESSKEQEQQAWQAQGEALLYWVNQTLRGDLHAQLLAAEADLKLGESVSRNILVQLGRAVPVGGAGASTSNANSLTKHGAFSSEQWTNLRVRAHNLYTSAPLSQIMHKLHMAVTQRKVAVRPDRKLHADIGLQVQILKWFRAINPIWLRLGLETVFGEVLPPGDHRSLWRFVGSRLLSDPVVLKKHGHKDVRAALSADGAKRVAELFLERTLRLVIFWDLAKKQQLMQPDVMLFLKAAPFKTTRELLVEMIKTLVSAEGNLLKTLAKLGFVPSFEQTRLDEYDFVATNLAIDLRNGVLLAKLAVVLTADSPASRALMKQLRFPATDLQRKTHNVQLAMNKFTDDGLDLTGIQANPDIVHAWRPPLFDLLWRLVQHYLDCVFVPVQCVERELVALRTELASRPAAPQQPHTTAVAVSNAECGRQMQAVFGRVPVLWQWIQLCLQLHTGQTEEVDMQMQDCSALCALVQFYAPQTQVQSPSDNQTFSAQHNLRVLYQQLCVLLGEDQVPVLFSAPLHVTLHSEPRVLVLLAAVLCDTLLPLGAPKRAAMVLQRVWRQYVIRRDLHKRLRLLVLVVRLQRAWRDTLHRREQYKRVHAAIVIQRHYRRTGRFMLFWMKLKALMQLHSQARKIQWAYRAYRARQQFLVCRASAVKMQAFVRMALTRLTYLRLRRSVIRLQACVRGKFARETLSTRRQAVAVLERAYRAHRFCQYWSAVVAELHRHRMATKIQSVCRMHRVRVQYLQMRTHTLAMQRCRRAKVQRAQYLCMLQAAVRIQSVWRACRVWRRVALERRAVRVLESAYKDYRQRVFWRVLITNARAIIAQRARLAHAATRIQACYRGYVGRVQADAADVRVVVARHRLQHANTLAENGAHVSLWAKCKRALLDLDSESMVVLHEALLTLERGTYAFVECCEQVVAHPQAIPKLCGLLEHFNQSDAMRHTVEVASQLLRNVCKPRACCERLIAEGHSAPVLQVMAAALLRAYGQNTHTHTFNHLCSVLTALCQHDALADQVRANEELVSCLRHIYHQLSDQHSQSGSGMGKPGWGQARCSRGSVHGRVGSGPGVYRANSESNLSRAKAMSSTSVASMCSVGVSESVSASRAQTSHSQAQQQHQHQLQAQQQHARLRSLHLAMAHAQLLGH